MVIPYILDIEKDGQRIDIVFDTYVDNSLKVSTRGKRGKGTEIRKFFKYKSMQSPTQSQDFDTVKRHTSQRSIGTQTQTQTRSTQTCNNHVEEIPEIILNQAVNIIDYFDCEICRDDLRVTHQFLRDILPNKILILKDRLLIYLKKYNLSNWKFDLTIKLSEYIKNKISNILKDLWKDNKIEEHQYLTLMKALKRACGLPTNY
ncbi:unnamed protein product [Mytilus coruscus]|uniref:Uncharacterized protein n=1 Tax=Mytilus coruscus TaxID=42192 RepID=A0A6J7ZZP9_MYTCO|nr:unnamed protein product [Mytilus coruscus]